MTKDTSHYFPILDLEYVVKIVIKFKSHMNKGEFKMKDTHVLNKTENILI